VRIWFLGRSEMTIVDGKNKYTSTIFHPRGLKTPLSTLINGIAKKESK
jgi:hypothetical protein